MPKKPHVMIAEARYHNEIADHLLAGASAALDAAGATYEVFTVPGALELPITVSLGDESGRFDAFVVLGCVIRTAQYHFEVVCNESARALGDLALREHIAIGNGILTVENYQDALERADPAQKNRGADAAKAALAVLEIKNKLAGKK